MQGVIRNIMYYLQLVWEKPLYFILPALLVFSGGFYYAWTMPRNYYSEALLIMEFQQVPSALVHPTVSNERLQLVEQRLLTRENLLDLANKFDLFPEPRQSLPTVKLAELVRKHIAFDTSIAEASDQYSGSTLVRVGFNYDSPDIAQAVANELAIRVIEAHKRARVARANETVEFLKHEVNTINARINEREADWSSYLESNKDALPARMPNVLLELQSAQQQLATQEQAIATLNGEKNLLEGQLRLGVEQSGAAVRLRSQLAALRQEIQQKSLVYSETHPEMLSLKQKLAELETQVAERNSSGQVPLPTVSEAAALSPELGLIATRLETLKVRQQAMNEQRQSLLDRMSQLNLTVARAPEVEAQMEAIRTEKEGLLRNLQDMNNRFEMARVGARLEQNETASPIEMIEAPVVPAYATNSRRLLLIVTLAFSLIAGMAGIYIADLLRKTIRGAFDLEDALQGRAVVLIPEWSPKPGRLRGLVSRS